MLEHEAEMINLLHENGEQFMAIGRRLGHLADALEATAISLNAAVRLLIEKDVMTDAEFQRSRAVIEAKYAQIKAADAEGRRKGVKE